MKIRRVLVVVTFELSTETREIRDRTMWNCFFDKDPILSVLYFILSGEAQLGSLTVARRGQIALRLHNDART